MSISQTLYYAAPIPAQNALVSAYGYYLKRKRRAASEHGRRLIARSRSWNEAEVSLHQARELTRMVRHCATNVPFYRRQWAEGGVPWAEVRSADDLHRLPILPKEAVRRHGASMRLPGARPYWTQHTSGSTGTPIVVQVNRRSYQLVHALLESHEAECGIGAEEWRATFAGRMVQPAGRASPPFWRYNYAQRQILFSAYHLSDRTLPYYLEELARRQPAEIIGYPSAIATVAALIKARGGRATIQPRVVITNSETVFAWQRAVIEEAFGCPVRDYYGSAEGLVFAPQCPAGAYHFNPLLGIAEIVDASGQPVERGTAGRLVCTTLTNDTMPLVRYEIGDTAVRLEGRCACGSVLGGAREILGREDDLIVTPDGRAVGRIDHIFKGVVGIRECQVVQEAVDLVRLLVVSDPMFGEEEENLLRHNARVRLGDQVRIETARVPQIPRTSAGKFRGVISRLHPGQRADAASQVPRAHG